MLSVDEFEGLAVGDLIEAAPIFPALTGEPVILRTAQKAHDQAEFVVTYLGVTLGRWAAVKGPKGEIKWTLS